MAIVAKSKTSNKVLFDTLNELRKYSTKSEKKVYRAVAAKLSAPASQRPEVNISRIDKHAKDKETIIVPGKILGTGLISKKVTVIAFGASDSAKQKIEKAGGKFIEILDYLKTNPKDNPRIFG